MTNSTVEVLETRRMLAAQPELGINFGADRTDDNTNPLSVNAGEKAGVDQITNWNNESGKTGSATGLTDSTGAASSAGVKWQANGTWDAATQEDHTDAFDPTTQHGDYALMGGYLDNFGGTPAATNASLTSGNLDGNGILITGLDNTKTFDVYVYSLTAVFNRPDGVITVAGSTPDQSQPIATPPTPVNSYFAGFNGDYLIFAGVKPQNGNILIHGDGKSFRCAFNGVELVPSATQAPTAPTIGTATYAGGHVTVTFTDTSGNETGFQVQRSTDGTNFTTLNQLGPINGTGSAGSYVDVNVSPSTTYTYRVVAVNGAGSANSGTTSVTTPDHFPGFLASFYYSDPAGSYALDGDSVAGQAPPTPDGKGTEAQPSDDTAVLGYQELLGKPINYSGNDSVAPPDAPASFNPTAGPGNQGHAFVSRFSGFVTPTVTGFYTLGFATDDGGAITIADVDPTKVSASNPYGLVNPRTLVDMITALRGNTEDTAPVDEQWVAGKEYYVQFDMNNNGGGWDIHAYDAISSTLDNQTAGTFDLQGHQLLDPGLITPPVPLFKTIDAANLGGLAKDDPFYTGTAVGGPNSVELDFNNIGADSYNIYRSDSQNGTYTKINAAPVAGHAGVVKYTDTGLNNGQTYFYIVTGVNESGETSPLSAGLHISGSPLAHPPLPSPTVGVQACDPGTLALTINDTSSKVKQFKIEQSTDGTTFTTAATVDVNANGATTYAATGLDASKTYTFRVTAVGDNNPFADSAPTTTTGVKPNNTPHVPVNYTPDFASNQGNLQLNSGGADLPTFTTPTGGTGTALQLTGNNGGEAVSAFTTTYEHVDSFDTTFNFEFTGDQNADGLTFTVQNDPRGDMAVGGGGGALGYQGITNSVAVKFDLWNGGPTATTTGVYTNGEGPGDAPVQTPGNPDPAPLHTSVDLSTSGFDFHANMGDVYAVHLAYDGKVLTETITDTTLAAKPSVTIHYNIDIPSIVGGPCAFVGFTAGTGGAQAEQDILSWKYTAPVAAQFNKADFNHSGKVDFADLLILAQNYGKTGVTNAQGDANGDGKVDFADLLILAQNYGKTGPQAAKTRGSLLSDVVGLVKTH